MSTRSCCSSSQVSPASSTKPVSSKARINGKEVTREGKPSCCTASTVLKVFAVVGAIILALGVIALLSLLTPQAGALTQIFSHISHATGVVAAHMGIDALALAYLGASTGLALIIGCGLSACAVTKDAAPKKIDPSKFQSEKEPVDGAKKSNEGGENSNSATPTSTNSTTTENLNNNNNNNNNNTSSSSTPSQTLTSNTAHLKQEENNNTNPASSIQIQKPQLLETSHKTLHQQLLLLQKKSAKLAQDLESLEQKKNQTLEEKKQILTIKLLIADLEKDIEALSPQEEDININNPDSLPMTRAQMLEEHKNTINETQNKLVSLADKTSDADKETRVELEKHLGLMNQELVLLQQTVEMEKKINRLKELSSPTQEEMNEIRRLQFAIEQTDKKIVALYQKTEEKKS